MRPVERTGPAELAPVQVSAPLSSAAGGPAGRCCRGAGLSGDGVPCGRTLRVSEMMPPGTAAMSNLRDTSPVAQSRAPHAVLTWSVGFTRQRPSSLCLTRTHSVMDKHGACDNLKPRVRLQCDYDLGDLLRPTGRHLVFVFDLISLFVFRRNLKCSGIARKGFPQCIR